MMKVGLAVWSCLCFIGVMLLSVPVSQNIVSCLLRFVCIIFAFPSDQVSLNRLRVVIALGFDTQSTSD